MGEIAYDMVVAELVISGIEPRFATALAGLFEPEEVLEFVNEQQLTEYINAILDMHPAMYELRDLVTIMKPELEDQNPLVILEEIRRRRVLIPAQVYIDGSNLLISSSEIIFDKHIEEKVRVIDWSVLSKKFQKRLDMFRYKYNLWFGFPCVLAGELRKTFLYEKPIIFISAYNGSKRKKWTEYVHKVYGFRIILTPFEDAEMKNYILRDLEDQKVEHFVFGTGDGNRRDEGLSFVDIVQRILSKGKTVTVCGFRHSVHSDYLSLQHDNYRFIDLENPILMQGYFEGYGDF